MYTGCVRLIGGLAGRGLSFKGLPSQGHRGKYVYVYNGIPSGYLT
jgi:hypothetical protein